MLKSEHPLEMVVPDMAIADALALLASRLTSSGGDAIAMLICAILLLDENTRSENVSPEESREAIIECLKSAQLRRTTDELHS